MGLEALELVEGGQRRVFVVQMDDEADRCETIPVVIEERAARRALRERPAEGVLNEARIESGRVDLPELL